MRVTTTPNFREADLRYSGTPAGEVRLNDNGIATIRAEVESGQHHSTLALIDPDLVNAGYYLASITCDDPGSARRSSGNLENRKATFEIEDDETVTCTFALQQPSFSCKCPKEGNWNVVNNTGSMACTGVVSMTSPLAASSSKGTLEVNDACDTVLAKGMSDDEADLEMRLQPDCSWLGTVGAEQDGVPMVITFRWNLENEKRILGDLESTVSQQGMICRMSRTFRLDFES
ncbi:hypothetical protein [Dokdonella sp.]|uniref:hypothetical protein n=1 Tax=Dokdonella sp. TaxID=2291710 RepID=UPI003C645E89